MPRNLSNRVAKPSRACTTVSNAARSEDVTIPDVNPDDDIRAADGLRLPAEALEWRFDRAGGPGGQHRNKVSTRVSVRADLSRLEGPAALTARVRTRLGDSVVLSEGASRSQWRNRVRVIERLKTAIDDAARPERKRRATRPTRGAAEDRLAEKRRASKRKQDRRRVNGDDPYE